MLPGCVLPVMSLSQALRALANDVHGVPMQELALFASTPCPGSKRKWTYFLFLHSPVKANWFSGLPSGIL